MNVRKVSWVLPGLFALGAVYALIVALTQDGGGLEWVGVIAAGLPWSLLLNPLLGDSPSPLPAATLWVLSAVLNLYLLTVLAMWISRDPRLARVTPRKVSSLLMRRWPRTD